MATGSRKIASQVVFEGLPGAVKAVIPIPSESRRSVSVDIDWPAEHEARPVRVLTAPAGRDLTHVRLVFPPDTDPGTYEAVVRSRHGELPAVLTVLGYHRLRARPAALDLEIPAAGEATHMITIANQGNTLLEVKRSYVAGLSEEFGIDNAVGAAIASNARGVDRWGALADDFARRHAGLLRISVQKGSGRLLPGELKPVECTFRISAQASATRVYTAIWRLHDLHLPIRITVASETTKDPS